MKILKNELYKSMCNGFFIASLIIGFVVQMFSVQQFQNEIVENAANLAAYAATLESARTETLTALYENTAYLNWISQEAFYTTGANITIFLIPLIAVLPYGWSFCQELRGYHYQMIFRSSKMKYFSSKYLASFVSGALAVAFILLSNFIVCAFLWPLETPYTWCVRTAISRGLLGSELFYTQPFIFVLLWTLIAALFGGALSGLVMFFAQFINNAVFVMIIPFVVPILHDNIIYILLRTDEYSMMNNYFCGSATYNEAVLFGQIIALIAVGYLGGLLLYRRRDALT